MQTVFVSEAALRLNEGLQNSVHPHTQYSFLSLVYNKLALVIVVLYPTSNQEEMDAKCFP